MRKEETLKELNHKFIYKRDSKRWFDDWRILHGDGKWEGDCEDYSLTLMWMLSDRSVVKFLWNILIMKHLMWFVKSPNGEGRAIVKIDGMYYDNIQKKATTKEELLKQGYKFVFPMIAPFAYIKLLLSYTIGRLL